MLIKNKSDEIKEIAEFSKFSIISLFCFYLIERKSLNNSIH